MLSNRRLRCCSALALSLAFGSCALLVWSQAAPQNLTRKSAGAAQGKQTFASTCAQCHGLDAKGSERGPNIAERASVQRLSDTQIFHVIENGVPGTGMPAFHALQSSQIHALVAYLRILQGRNKTAALPGNAEQGKTMFFGRGGCSECHMVAGQGGFIASDLSEYARTHTVEQIRGAIVDPGNSARTVRLVTASLRDGQEFIGRVRDEDNFSLQLQTLDGTFHFLSKSDIGQIEPNPQPLMPSDYGSRLGVSQLNDLISYLMNVAGARESSTPKKADEWDE